MTMLLLALAAIAAGDADGSGAVPAPEPVKTDVRVGTYIFPGWYRSPLTSDYPYANHDQESEWETIARFETPRPILGYYNDALPEVNDWHIKWALEAGISWFAFDWYWNAGEQRLRRSLEEGFLNAEYGPMMDFCIHWCNHGLDWKKPLDFGPDALEEMIRFCAENYFPRPNYLKIDGRPVFMVWDIESVVKQNGGAERFADEVIPRLNAALASYGIKELFLIAVHNAPHLLEPFTFPDAATGYSYAWCTPSVGFNPPGRVPYERMIEALPGYWDGLRKTLQVPFIVGTQSGWDNSTRTVGAGNPDGLWVLEDNRADLFARSLREGVGRIEPDLPLFLIEAWNEWGEGSFIEPSTSHGFAHLSAIRKAFAPDAPTNTWVRPTAEQIEAYQVQGIELAPQSESNPTK